MLENEKLGERDAGMLFSICKGDDSVGFRSARGVPYSLGTMTPLGHIPSTGGVIMGYLPTRGFGSPN